MADLTQSPRRIVTGHTPTGSATVLYEGKGHETSASIGVKLSVLWQAEHPNKNESPTEDAANWVVGGHGFTRENGSICRVVDYPPGDTVPMHRHTSLDYGIVVAGEGLELELKNEDGGENEIRRLKIGDVVVQRGTHHAWHNRGKDWGRMVYVIIGAEEIVLNGEVLKPIGLPG
jgi:quercetin dioxygenase-like cupin family protein